ncbi:hypothetical protein KUTeg_009282, partial [Tegillarca granosa]
MKETLNSRVSIQEVVTDTIVILKIENCLSPWSENIYVLCSYIPPEKSIFYKLYDCDLMFELEKIIEKYSSTGKIIIVGDLNSRTSNKEDFIVNDLIAEELQQHCREIVATKIDYLKAVINCDLNTQGDIDNCHKVLKKINHCDRHLLGYKTVPKYEDDKPWFTFECKQLYRLYLQSLRDFNKNKTDETHYKLHATKRKYKTLETKLKRDYLQQQGDMVSFLRTTNPKLFYKTFSKQKICEISTLIRFREENKKFASIHVLNNGNRIFILRSDSIIYDVKTRLNIWKIKDKYTNITTVVDKLKENVKKPNQKFTVGKKELEKLNARFEALQ